eukprot:7053110-Ditylum_brightwellii.AAC.1
MESDIFTKNCAHPVFKKHAAKFVGHIEYMAEGIDHGTPKGIPKGECQRLDVASTMVVIVLNLNNLQNSLPRSLRSSPSDQ